MFCIEFGTEQACKNVLSGKMSKISLNGFAALHQRLNKSTLFNIF